jgi:hypothetical protein
MTNWAKCVGVTVTVGTKGAASRVDVNLPSANESMEMKKFVRYEIESRSI